MQQDYVILLDIEIQILKEEPSEHLNSPSEH